MNPLNPQGQEVPASPPAPHGLFSSQGGGWPTPPTLLQRIFFNRREPRAGWRLLLFLVISAVCMLVLSLPTHLFLRPSRSGVALSRFSPHFLVIEEGALVLAILIAASVMGLIEKRSFRDYALPWRSAFGTHFWWGVLWGGISITGLLLLIRFYHGFSFGGLALTERRALFVGTLWAAAFLVVGFFEEFLFRGYALSTLTTGMGFWPAAILLSLAFGAVHLANPGEDWKGGAAAALIGLFFCFTVRRTGSLWFAIGFHAMWDFSETFLYSVPNSGIVASGHLLNSSFHGPKWLTGGAVGPEGSLFVFIIIVNLFLVFHLLHHQNKFPILHDATASCFGQWRQARREPAGR